ncbi:MAG: 8-amino-7-oxononanoate synthase [Pseudomonadota bacterium]|nr:8-amino-7-oxononanoate synthase [Pseudomonadota bacterium]
MEAYLQRLLAQRHHCGLYRVRMPHQGRQRPILHQSQADYLAFCSNDYLGLAADVRVQAACQQGLQQYGVGSGAAHLLSGHTQAHQQLEQALAQYTGRERALLFSNGYMANLGVISALMGRQDALFLDKLNHASIIDAAVLSRAKIYRYRHHDLSHLAQLLAPCTARYKLIITDGVFSMDGDIAPLPGLVEVAQRYHAWVMVDDAHGLGVLGAQGRGSLEHFALSVAEVPILMGTLGKAFGVFGAFVAGSHALIETLIQFARSYIYTTALPPAWAQATLMSLTLAQQEPWRRQRLYELIAYYRTEVQRRQLNLMVSNTPIQPLILNDAEHALRLSQHLYQHGILVPAIRPPTVPTARLRVSLSALHEPQHLDTLLDCLGAVLG